MDIEQYNKIEKDIQDLMAEVSKLSFCIEVLDTDEYVKLGKSFHDLQSEVGKLLTSIDAMKEQLESAIVKINDIVNEHFDHMQAAFLHINTEIREIKSKKPED